MKLADRVIDLMAAFPNKWFRMGEIVTYIDPDLNAKKNRETIRKQVKRVLLLLQETGSLEVRVCKVNGSYSTYRWK